jgi:hypothetical protein
MICLALIFTVVHLIDQGNKHILALTILGIVAGLAGVLSITTLVNTLKHNNDAVDKPIYKSFTCLYNMGIKSRYHNNDSTIIILDNDSKWIYVEEFDMYKQIT